MLIDVLSKAAAMGFVLIGCGRLILSLYEEASPEQKERLMQAVTCVMTWLILFMVWD